MEFNESGITIESLEEIQGSLEQGMRNIYGQDINLDQDTPDGQRISISAKMWADFQEFVRFRYNSNDPDLAIGHQLDVVSKIAGITRRPATQSTWDIDVEASANTTLEAAYTIRDDLSQEWQLDEALPILAGVTSVTFTAVDFGAVAGFAGADLEQVTVNTSISALSAPSNSTVGVDEETNEQLRLRRSRSTENPARGSVGSLFAALANPATTPGVTDLEIYENKDDPFDSSLQLNGHSIWVVIEGGTIDDIINTMGKDDHCGTGMKGAIEGVYQEIRNLPNGQQRTHQSLFRFDRPTYIELSVNLTAERKITTDPIDLDLIKQKIASFEFKIGEELDASKLYDFGYQAGANFNLRNLQISDGGLFTDGILSPGFQGKFILDVANISITEIV